MTESEHLPSSGFFITFVILASLCIIFGILGNITVIGYNVFMIHTKTPTSYFVVSLAFADIIVSSTYFPAWIVEFTQILRGTEGNQKLICKIAETSTRTSIALSICNLLAITVDRFLFITRPLKYPMIMTWPKTYAILIVIWFSAIINASLLAFYTDGAAKRLYCQVDWFVSCLLVIIYFWIPFFAFLVFNYKIFKVARNQRRRITVNFVPSSFSNMPCSNLPDSNMSWRGRMPQLKVIKTFAIVNGIFLLCTFPNALIKMAEAFGCDVKCMPTSWSVATGLLLGANSVFNPFIYGVRHKEYRNAVRQLFTKLYSGG